MPGRLSARVPLPLLATAMLFPTVAAWLYFIRLAGEDSARSAYLIGKVVQFALPLLVLSDRRFPKTAEILTHWRSQRAHVVKWTGISVAVCIGTALVYGLILRGSPLADAAALRIAPKLQDFGVSRFASYLALALVLSFVHSFLEEYYFRWFVFGGLQQRASVRVATLLSSLAFASHHVIVVSAYLGADYWPLIAAVSAGVCATGIFWAWLYQRTGSLLAPWSSHVVSDLLIMAIGWDLVSRF